MPRSIKQLEENLKGCVEEITSKKEEMTLLTGKNQTFFYQFSYKDFWKSLTTEPNDKLSEKKGDFMVMQQIFKAAEQVCEKELNRRKWQNEYNMKTAQQKHRFTRAALKRKKADEENCEQFLKLKRDDRQSSIGH